MLHVVHGQTRHALPQRALLESAIKKAGIDGTLYFGYPVLTTAESRQRLDALLVSQDCGVAGLLLAASAPLDEQAWQELTDEQDGLFVSLETQLGRHASLRNRRKIAVPIHVLTVLPNTAARSDPDNGFVTLGDLSNALSGLEGIDDPELYRKVQSVVEHVATIKPPKKRDDVKQPNSPGAKLKRIEQEIATLDRWQKEAAIATPDGPQRIRGLAGSGKTIVLALKAAYLHAQHPEWKIAVVFYTQALYQQFQDLIRRFCFEHLQDEPDWSRIRILHAWGSYYRSGFYSEVAEAAGVPARNWASALAQFGREQAFDGCCRELLQAPPPAKEALYDAVLVDEAQDLPPSFFQLVYRNTTKEKRIVWAYDELQQLAAETVPGAQELFGTDERGIARVSLEDKPGEAQHDVVLPVCYRNPPWTLTVAHGLGFGTARSKGLVQHFDDPSLWDDVGYEPVEGQLALGAKVRLRRRTDSYPEFFAREIDPADAVSYHSFPNDTAQIDWIVSSVQNQLERDELRPDDFLIVLPNEYTAKSRGSAIVSAFAYRGIRAHNAGIHTDRDVVFQEGSIAVAHIYRAKGNEAPVVYIVDAQYASAMEGGGGLGLASRRNKLFTAITRSRAWVRICGVGPAMTEIETEVAQIQRDNYELSFEIPTLEKMAKLRQLHRDRTEQELRRVERRKKSLADLGKAAARGELTTEEFDSMPTEDREALLALLRNFGDDQA